MFIILDFLMLVIASHTDGPHTEPLRPVIFILVPTPLLIMGVVEGAFRAN